MWSTSLRRLSFLFMQRKKLKVVWFFKLGKLRKWWLNKQNFCFYALVRNSGERWGKVGKRWGKTQVKFIYLLLWFFLTLLYPCSILPNRVSSRNLLRGLVIAMMWYRSHQFDCLWLQQPPVRTCCFYFGSKRCQEEMGVLAQASPGTLQGMRSPAGMKAGGWRQGREVDVLGAARWGTWPAPVQPGRFLWLSAACVWKDFTAFRCDVFVWFWVLVLIRITEDQV